MPRQIDKETTGNETNNEMQLLLASYQLQLSKANTEEQITELVEQFTSVIESLADNYTAEDMFQAAITIGGYIKTALARVRLKALAAMFTDDGFKKIPECEEKPDSKNPDKDKN